MISLFFESEEFLEDVKSALKIFGDNIFVEKRELPKGCFDKEREQLMGDSLISFLPEESPSLWLLQQDLYLKGTKFIFGFAFDGRAVLSIFRLDKESVKGEAIHEVGHTMGLEHCKNPCVMAFSASVSQSKERPKGFCKDCAQLLNLSHS